THTGVYNIVDTKPGVYLCDSAAAEKCLKQIDDLRDYRLVRIDKDKIIGITIESERADIGINKKNDQWYVKIEGNLKDADPDIVASMLEKLSSLKGYQSADDNPDLVEKYGLLKPKFLITLRDPEKEYTIRFGKETDDKKGIYTNSSFSPVVYIVDLETFKSFDRTPNEIRNRMLNRFKAIFINKIKIQKGDLNLELEKDLDLLDWNFAKPIKCLANSEIINEITHDLEGARGEKILDLQKEGIEDYGLAKPELSIYLLDQKEKKEYTFFFGSKIEDDLIACMNSKEAEIFLVPSKVMAHIPQDIFKGLRNKGLSRVKSYACNHVAFLFPNSYLECRMDSKGKWIGIKPKIIEMSKIFSQLLSDIDNLTIVDFVDDTPKDLATYGLKTPKSYIQLSNESKVLEKIYIGNTMDYMDEVFVRLEASSSVYTIKKSVLEKMQKLAVQIIGQAK
ncbi:DUF4340 domain-containing protein, partial [bacterium]|nr:DUF4340 domain-containing protein [bacterium]